MRRPLAAALGLALLAAAGALLLARWEAAPSLSFRDHPSAPGFRILAAGGGASAGDVLSAILAPPEETRPPASGNLCRDLWSAPGLPASGPAGDRPRLAVFSDANCPFCRRLDETLEALLADRPDLRLVHHEWPVLAESSVTAARAALAAARQDAFRPVQRRLLKSSFLPTPAYVRAVAEAEGLDADRLLDDMQAPAIDRTLAATARAARALGLQGTPALVVGGTLAEGAIDRATIEALIEAETERAERPCP
ncbi:MAG: DsbA family protein [Pseudomonadota bacterium]